jgi:hypothetical protein
MFPVPDSLLQVSRVLVMPSRHFHDLCPPPRTSSHELCPALPSKEGWLDKLTTIERRRRKQNCGSQERLHRSKNKKQSVLGWLLFILCLSGINSPSLGLPPIPVGLGFTLLDVSLELQCGFVGSDIPRYLNKRVPQHPFLPSNVNIKACVYFTYFFIMADSLDYIPIKEGI